jgi:glycerol uptake facilitator-like aquaporin
VQLPADYPATVLGLGVLIALLGPVSWAHLNPVVTLTVHRSTHDRSAGHLWLGEVVAVAACIGAAYWFTSSTSFAHPAVTIGRAFTDTFAGIAPASVAPFLAAQLAGGGLGLVLVAVAIGRPVPATGDGVVVTHGERRPTSPARPTEESAVSS